MEAKRVTIKDIATASGVTPQTVSRVFRGNGYVAHETKKRVLEAAEKLKYVPNGAAIMLRTGVAKRIAVVFDSLINVYFSVMVDYLQKELQEQGYQIQTVFVNSHTIDEAVYREALSMGVSAVISFLEPEQSLAGPVRDFGVPLMILGRRTECEAFDYITTDDVHGGELAAKRLVEDGCTSFGYLAAAFGLTCVRDRLCGFEAELSRHGHSVEVINSTSGGVLDALAAKAASGGIPDGIFCFSDMLAYETLNALGKLNVKNVKVIGYDNIQADISMPINLTTIGVDKPQYVKSVVQALLDKIEGRAAGRVARSADVSLHGGETA